MKIIKFILILLQTSCMCYSQGFTNVWELGYDSDTLPECYVDFTGGIATSHTFVRPMNLDCTNASICDSSGQLLFYTNGVYIANKIHDTLLNGSGLNPGLYAQVCGANGLIIPQGDLILPLPHSTTKYILIHETINVNANFHPTELFYSEVDMNLDGGLGGVTQKNVLIVQDHFDCGELTGCKHANGEDWWVVAHKNMSNLFYKILISSGGIARIDTQSVPGPITDHGGTSLFSPDGKFYASFDNLSKLRLYDFDRCSGTLSNMRYINFVPDSVLASGLSFSPNSSLLYVSTLTNLYQFDLYSPNIETSRIHIATWDGFYSPFYPLACNFVYHMLGPDGKIYICSGSSVVDLNVINLPDNVDTSCNFTQHSFYLGSYNNTSLPNHINYWLGPEAGSPCDTILSVKQNSINNFNLQVAPNPISNQMLNVCYRMPQYSEGTLELIDLNGKTVFLYHLPMWSTQQSLMLPKMSPGLYALSLVAGNNRMIKKIVIE